MTLFDRYVLRFFVRIFAVCFVSLAGLFTVIHLFTNLDEMIVISNQQGGASYVAKEFYWPRICLFFDQTAPLLALTASIFSFLILQRTNQTTAVEAGGISKARIVRPLLIACIFLIGIGIVNREWLLPKHRVNLARNAQTWLDNHEQKMPFQIDRETGVVIKGNKIRPATMTITNPEFQIPVQSQQASMTISGKSAKFVSANERHPEGYLFQGMNAPVKTMRRADDAEFSDLVLGPDDYPWLKRDECFVACRISVHQIAYGKKLDRFAPVGELIRESRNPSLYFSNHQRVEIHTRLVRPLLDFSIFLLGLPLVIGHRDRNVFLAAMMCLGVVILMQLVMIGSSSLGSMRLIKSAALAAWIPVIIFLPWSLATFQALRR